MFEKKGFFLHNNVIQQQNWKYTELITQICMGCLLLKELISENTKLYRMTITVDTVLFTYT